MAGALPRHAGEAEHSRAAGADRGGGAKETFIKGKESPHPSQMALALADLLFVKPY